MKREFIKANQLIATLFTVCLLSLNLHAQQITFKPYIQLGDAGGFGPVDQIVVAWQTNETTPNPGAYTVHYGNSLTLVHQASVKARIVDNYLTADPNLASLSIPTAYGAHTNYYAVLTNLSYDTTFFYEVAGPGLPAAGFASSFHTRKRGTRFSFQVQGDEGYYPGIPKMNPAAPNLTANFEARIIHTMFNVSNLSIPGLAKLPPPDFALNTGDNVYVAGADSNYRDMWMPDWNSDIDSNERGAPYIRSIPLFIVDGNHDVGGTGATANLLADSGATVPGFSGPGPFGGGVGGGDALAFFNNYYFPLNGPKGVDIQYRWAGDTSTPSNFFFQYSGFNGGQTSDSPLAIEALRASTNVDTGAGSKRQIDRMSNYSFDYGNAHFVFLDANPHLFDDLLPGGNTYQSAATFPFPSYPSVLRDWLINDLDQSKQMWKIVVYHQPAFSSGNATLRNDQMRNVAKLLEDHGVNIVFNGHEHNYQRTLPLRALAGATLTPTSPGPSAVAVDTAFNGTSRTVPDGVLYFVEGAGGNRDFDDGLPNPRGSDSNVIDQDDSATGSFTPAGFSVSFPNGPMSWLDTNLTNTAMTPFLPSAGSGPKITARFKAKVFSFANVVVDSNELTLYQISEPLTNSSSASPTNPAPFGTDINGHPLNDPIPDTVFDPATHTVVSPPAVGKSALLDKVTIDKPNAEKNIVAKLSAPARVLKGSSFIYSFDLTNQGPFALNGTQIVMTLPDGVSLLNVIGAADVTTIGPEVVVTLGRLVPEERRTLQLRVQVPATGANEKLVATGVIRSSTALPITTNTVKTKISKRENDDNDTDGNLE